MKCPQCNTVELSGKQKYCSGACRVAASRQAESLQAEPKPDVPIIEKSPVVPVVPQYRRAVLVTQDTEGAIPRRIPGGIKWVIEGYCNNGPCKNPKCPTFTA